MFKALSIALSLFAGAAYAQAPVTFSTQLYAELATCQIESGAEKCEGVASQPPINLTIPLAQCEGGYCTGAWALPFQYEGKDFQIVVQVIKYDENPNFFVLWGFESNETPNASSEYTYVAAPTGALTDTVVFTSKRLYSSVDVAGMLTFFRGTLILGPPSQPSDEIPKL